MILKKTKKKKGFHEIKQVEKCRYEKKLVKN